MPQTQATPTEDNGYTSEERGDNFVFTYITVTFTLGIIVSALGIWSNISSMIIFKKLGLKDSMSVELFALSFTDFLVAIIQLVSCVCYILGICNPDCPVDILSLTTLVCGYAMGCVYFISCWITTFISIERCLCVVYPFKVKQIFTRSRCIKLILVTYAIFISIHAPAYALFKVRWIDTVPASPSANTTETQPTRLLTVIATEEAMLFETTYDLTMTVTMTIIIQVIVIGCALWMGYSLEISAKIRQTNTDSKPTNGPELHRPLSAKVASTLSVREKRLVKIVLVLAIMVIVGNVPKFIIVGLYYTILPGMEFWAQQRTSTILWTTGCLCVAIGSSANFLVFIRLNSSYRTLFHQLCNIKGRK